MKKTTPPMLKTALALFFCLLGALLIWLISQYSASQSPTVLYRCIADTVASLTVF